MTIRFQLFHILPQIFFLKKLKLSYSTMTYFEFDWLWKKRVISMAQNMEPLMRIVLSNGPSYCWIYYTSYYHQKCAVAWLFLYRMIRSYCYSVRLCDYKSASNYIKNEHIFENTKHTMWGNTWECSTYQHTFKNSRLKYRKYSHLYVYCRVPPLPSTEPSRCDAVVVGAEHDLARRQSGNIESAAGNIRYRGDCKYFWNTFLLKFHSERYFGIVPTLGNVDVSDITRSSPRYVRAYGGYGYIVA